ncbi:uncharacterized protein ABDE67_002236 [Symphorus nematophorus]
MNQSEDREEGVRPSRTTLCGGHEAQRIHQRPQSAEPGPEPEPEPGPGPQPSCVSFKSDRSKEAFIDFKQRIHQRPDSSGPEPSCVSFKSDWSKGRLINFKGHQPYATKKRKLEKPEPSSLSMKSDRCKDHHSTFKDRHQSADQRKYGRPASDGPGPGPGPSCVSFKSDWSKGRLINFKGHQPFATKKGEQESSEIPCGPSAQQHQTHLDSTFKLLEENIVSFVKDELKKFQRVLKDEEVLHGEDEEQEKSSREAFLKITLHFLRRMKQGELADCLQRSKRIYLKM